MSTQSFRKSDLFDVSLALMLGMGIVAIYLMVTIAAHWIAPYGQTEIVGDVWEPSSARFWLGTDNLGRDMFSRLIYGTQTTLIIAILATLIAFVGGSFLGTVSALSQGGWTDWMLSRAVDVIMAFPVLIFALVVISGLGSSPALIIAIIAVVHGSRVFRISRAVAMNIVSQDYIEICRLRRDPMLYVIFREILPNAAPPLAAEYGVRLNFAILFVSSLSFLGLGIQPPDADWGSMVRENSEAMAYGIPTPLYPAFALMIFSFGINLIVDWSLSRTTRAAKGEH
ncbi:ABC transporter permease [Roseovarius sp. 2305UL8-3]|uniref:ABC transporter permease n=1 Tax=Roseovarius conchicola TaxID=3121636 RepID=UPI003526CD3D